MKILVSEPGVYQVDAAQLKSVGWDVDKIDPSQVQVANNGRVQPVWVDGEGSDLKIRFYAQERQSRYTRQNVYWLIDRRSSVDFEAKIDEETDSTENVRIPTSSTIENPDPTSAYISTLEFEQNMIYSPQAGEIDPWMWASIPAPQSWQFEFELSEVVSGPGRVGVVLWGSTEAPESPDHHLRLSLNEGQIADEYWDGKGSKRIQADIPFGLLKNGMNKLQLEAPGDTGVIADVIVLNRILLEYPRKLVAGNDRLAFFGAGEIQVLSGFSEPVQVYDITDARAVNLEQALSDTEPSFEFEGQENHHYLLLGPRGYLQPDALMLPVLSPDLVEMKLGADYLVIGPKDLLEPFQPLFDQRESQGFEPLALPVEAIYDQFNHGFPEPEALRAFLRYAVANWDIAPQYVLLVGDSTYDPQGYLGSTQANRLPVFFIDTVYGGETASDVVLARLDDDAWPDIAIGRIPAQTAKQVEVWVEKLLEFERTEPSSGWDHSILAIADGQDRSFQRDAQRFLDRFPDDYQQTLVSPEAGSKDTNIEIKGHIEAGSFLVAYFGHGSVNTWGQDRLFSTEDVGGLSNQGRYPLVVNMTCLTGLFTHPKIDSLAESLLWHQNGGAVAVLAPTSLTLPTDQSFLSNAFVDAFVADSGQTIGDILLAARQNIPGDTPGARDVLETFLLFGDPAMKLR